jgi:hypothetical protein
LTEDQVRTDQQTAPLVAFGKEGEEHFHLFAALLDIAEIIKDNSLEAIEFFEQALQFKSSSSPPVSAALT